MGILQILRRYSPPVASALVDLVLPRFCSICGPLVSAGDLPNICLTCTDKLILQDGDAQCLCCACPIQGYERIAGRCLGCFRRRPPWTRLVVLGAFDGLLAELVRKLKFDKDRSCAAPLGELLAAQGKVVGWKKISFDGIVPIPLSPAKQRSRGFNQAELISIDLAKAISTPLKCRWLQRSNSAQSQVGRHARARRRLAQGTFEAHPMVFGQRILVVDDVVTTQATLLAAVGALKKAGALEVQVIACARTDLRR